LLDQHYNEDIEKPEMDILIIDDGSTDYSVDVIKYYDKKLDCIKAKYRKENIGIGKTRNELLEMVRVGEYDFFIIMDSDDMATQTLVNNTIAAFNENEGGDVYYNSYHHLDYLKNPIGNNFEIEAPDEDKITIMNGAGKQNVAHGGLCVRKKFFHIDYPEDKHGEDHEYLYKLMENGAIFKKVPVHWNKENTMMLDAGFYYLRSLDSVSTVYKDEIEERDQKFFDMIKE
jgi:glycosyltransferase involved in cell wall biosynthesis